MPRYNLWGPPKIVQENTFSVLNPNPGKASGSGIKKSVKNQGQRIKYKKVLPQFALPLIIMFRYLPLPFIGRSHTASRNTCGGTWLLARISSAQIFHIPPQPSVHSFLSLLAITLGEFSRSCQFLSSILKFPCGIQYICDRPWRSIY